MIFKSAFI